jgi:hypothetical protein
MHSLCICSLPARISLIRLLILPGAFSPDVQIEPIESIYEGFDSAPSTIPRDHAWVNVLLLVCAQR